MTLHYLINYFNVEKRQFFKSKKLATNVSICFILLTKREICTEKLVRLK